MNKDLEDSSEEKYQIQSEELNNLKIPNKFKPPNSFLPPILGKNILPINRFITYSFKWNKNISWKGIRYKFQFSLGENHLYNVKTKQRKPTESIPIGEGSNIHLSQENFVGYLLIGNNNQSFSIRKNYEFGIELLSINICQNKIHFPRNINLTLFEKNDFIPKNLISLEPNLGINGRWQLCFFGKPAIPSIKNCVLIGLEDKLPYIMIRRINEDTIEIDAPEVFCTLSLFGLGLSVFFA